jgi:CRP/FNR family transcriptional regulator/CRP/FNR family nitrogen fixation transcriptional regulator
MYLTLATTVEADDGIVQPDFHARGQQTHKLYQRVQSGRHLFLEGDEARHVYEVQRGILRLARVMENGRRQIVAFGLPGDVVGFPAGDLHHTDCDAICDTVVLAHSRLALENSDMDRDLHHRLMQAALKEICAMQDHFMMLSSRSAAEKIASFLLTLADRTGQACGPYVSVDLAMRRVDIADFLGLTTETVCRTITQFRKDGLIALDTAQKVIIRDLDALRHRAEPA